MIRTVEVAVPTADVDLVSGLLWMAEVSAIGERPGPDGRVVLVTDVPPGGIDAIEDVLDGRWEAVEVDVVDDGLDRWREHATIASIGAVLVVVPPWIEHRRGPDDVVITIDPGRSFGHGNHPTTRAVLHEIDRLPFRDPPSVLDVGCGSGVLAIAAAALHADPVVAIDSDPEAIAATLANVAANNVAVVVSDTPVGEVEGTFDLVLANIGAATLIELAPALLAKVADEGRIVLSGLLADRADDVLAAYPGTVLERTQVEDGWTTLTLARSR